MFLFKYLLVILTICFTVLSLEEIGRKKIVIPYPEISKHLSTLQSATAQKDDLRTFSSLRYFADLYAELAPETIYYGSIAYGPHGMVVGVGKTGYVSGEKITANLNPAFVSGERYVMDDVTGKLAGSVIFMDIPQKDFDLIKTTSEYTMGTARSITKMRRPDDVLLSEGLVQSVDGCEFLKKFKSVLHSDPSYVLIIPSSYLCFDTSITGNTAYYAEGVLLDMAGGKVIIPTYVGNLNGVLLGQLKEVEKSPALIAAPGIAIGSVSIDSLPAYSLPSSVAAMQRATESIYSMASDHLKATSETIANKLSNIPSVSDIVAKLVPEKVCEDVPVPVTPLPTPKAKSSIDESFVEAHPHFAEEVTKPPPSDIPSEKKKNILRQPGF